MMKKTFKNISWLLQEIWERSKSSRRQPGMTVF